MASRLVKWLIFSVLFALMPLIVAAALLAARVAAPVGEVWAPIAQGQLLLVVAGLCGGALGELIGAGPRLRLLKLISGGGAVLFLFFSVAFYASLVQPFGMSTSYDPGFVVMVSVWKFGLSVLTCAGVIVLCEG